MAFRSFEAEVVAVPLDERGLDVDALEAALAAGLRPKLLYTIPDHQNPAGVTLAAERRAALVELARRYGFLIVEDVAYRELGFDGTAPPSLWSLGPDVVVQAGTTSKTFFPGVRLGWAAGPAEVVAQLVSAKQNTDQCSGALGQRLFEEYARRGWIDEQLERSRALYARKGARLLAALERTMPAGVEWTRPRGGFFSWLTVPVDAAEIARRAADEGVAVVPGALFYPDGRGTSNIRLSFSMVDEDADRRRHRAARGARLARLVRILLGRELPRALEHVLEVPLLNRQRPRDELADLVVPGARSWSPSTDQWPTSPASAIVRNSKPSSASASSSR